METNLYAGLIPPLTEEELQRIAEIVSPGGGRKIWPA